MPAIVSFGRPYARRICSIFPLWMESKALVKSTNNIVACMFFTRTPSRILRIINICEVVDLSVHHLFFFFTKVGHLHKPAKGSIFCFYTRRDIICQHVKPWCSDRTFRKHSLRTQKAKFSFISPAAYVRSKTTLFASDINPMHFHRLLGCAAEQHTLS